ncbi:gamma-glutamylcyclotransferase [Rhodobacterales bacterium HKCCE2091]|nr:gamma-glutamylcyclotransferase [Rhodobacterales bacterium HKCCE2091]
MSDPYFFGYGSLVNRMTHDYPGAVRARVSGWRRRWRKTKLRQTAFLSVHEAPGAEIDGLIARVPGSDWVALDLREGAYLRQKVTEIAHTAGPDIEVQIYRTKPELDSDAEHDHPILASYLDVVLQGYLREFGPEGLAHFIDTTDGWSAGLLDDRDDPVYPRWTRIEPGERVLIDAALEPVGLRLLPRDSVAI